MRHNNYKDFLQDPQFILWRLTSDKTLNEAWKQYQLDNPLLIDELNKAIELFGKVKLQEDKLPQQEQDELLARIHTSAATHNRKKQLLISRWSRVAVAASILILMGIGSYFFLNNPASEASTGLSADLIIGENLEEKEIYLITDNQTSSFEKDVYIEIDESGSAIVREINSDKSQKVTASASAMNKLVVPYGKQTQLVLADGTKVWVNSGSVLEFPSVFSEKERTVNLVGEMYIEVAKDDRKPFLVNTKQFQVKVYGTCFNVSAYNEDINNSVVLVEGNVGVQSTATDETRLQPNEMLTIAESKWEKSQVDVSLYTSWKDGYLLLNQTPIDEVLRQIERFYNLTFNIDIQSNPDLKQHTCTGKLLLSEDLDNVMTTISLLSSTRYMRDGKKIYININP